MSQSDGKKVDESWKQSADQEKSAGPQEHSSKVPDQADLLFFVSTLGMQALMSMGEIKDPRDLSQPRVDLAQAQYLIDIIQMLSDRTQGNLTPEESEAMQGLLYELRMKFVEKSAAK